MVVARLRRRRTQGRGRGHGHGRRCDADTDTDPTTEPVAVTGLGESFRERYRTVAVVSWTQDRAGDVTVEAAVEGEPWMAAPITAGVGGPNEGVVSLSWSKTGS